METGNPDMDKFAADMMERWESMKGNIYSSHDEAVAELTGAWKNTGVGQAIDESGFDWSAEAFYNVTQNAFEQASQEYRLFVSAVDWNEPWIVAMGCLHALLFGILLYNAFVGTGPDFKIGLFVFVAFLAGSATWLNTLGAAYWESFSQQNYFDENGLFLAITLCGPLVFVLFVLLLQLLFDVVKLMVTVKTKQLKSKAAREKKAGDKKND
ncbi:Transmembrane protein 18 [Diplonema papillatum]|nr:Transmembrane protein 18 [Diplonema papillatum]